MKIVTQLTIDLPSSVGSLAHVSDMLRAADVNIEALFCSEGSNGTTVAHLVVDDPETAKMVLGKVGVVKSADVLSIAIKNRPGSIAQVARKCAGAGINIEHIYAACSGNGGLVYLATSNPKQTAEIL